MFVRSAAAATLIVAGLYGYVGGLFTIHHYGSQVPMTQEMRHVANLRAKASPFPRYTIYDEPIETTHEMIADREAAASELERVETPENPV